MILERGEFKQRFGRVVEFREAKYKDFIEKKAKYEVVEVGMCVWGRDSMRQNDNIVLFR